MKTNSQNSATKERKPRRIVEDDLIPQLRRDTVPDYFGERDVQILAEKVSKAVEEVLGT